MIKYIGSYNIDNCGETRDDYLHYTTVIFSRFDENEKEIERKCLYFHCKIPNFKTEEEIAEFLKDKKNNQRICNIKIMYH